MTTDARLGIRELRADAAAMVRRAGTGERIVVTVNGHPVAQLGPVGGSDLDITIDDLVAAGWVVAPRRVGAAAAPGEPVPAWAGARLDRLLREIRG
jgi:prevent-host-death family protein